MCFSTMYNPFAIQKYLGPENFCDREDELASLKSAFDNQRNVVLSSIRRYGKTSLIQHFHHLLSQGKDTICVYADVLNTQSDQDFAKRLISSVLTQIHLNESRVTKLLQSFAFLRPKVELDPLTGMPNVSVSVETASEVNMSLESLFALIKSRKETFQIAIDEFQQIANYKITRTIDATLRTLMTTTPNVHFVFLGSERNLLNRLFINPNEPFYLSSEMMNLDKIEKGKYREFIISKFDLAGKTIESAMVDDILDWTQIHTFYTQFLCNTLYANSQRDITWNDVNEAKIKAISAYENLYQNYTRIFSKNQWKLIKAIAAEEEVSEIYSKSFLNKYRFSSSSLKQSLSTLIDQQMILEDYRADKIYYRVYDLFLAKWIQYKQI